MIGVLIPAHNEEENRRLPICPARFQTSSSERSTGRNPCRSGRLFGQHQPIGFDQGRCDTRRCLSETSEGEGDRRRPVT